MILGIGIGIGILIIINLLYDYISPQSAFFNLSFVWKEGLHDQVPVTVVLLRSTFTLIYRLLELELEIEGPKIPL